MRWVIVAISFVMLVAVAQPQQIQLLQPANSWVKRSPLANTPPSPRLGYEGACVSDSRRLYAKGIHARAQDVVLI